MRNAARLQVRLVIFLTLSWTTFSAAADESGISRRYGGYHFEQGDLDGREMGRNVAGAVWVKAQALFNETAPAPGGALPRTM